MPRAKTYDRATALEKARDAFWQYGYDALGVRAIEELTGLNRFAIQTEFGGKEGLFLEALEIYAQAAIEQIITPISAGGLPEIKQFFSNAIGFQKNDPRIFGCLMVNTVVENAAHNHIELKRRTDAHYARMLNAFYSALGNARDRGEISADFNIAEAASFLLGLAMGIQVYIRMTGTLSTARQQTNMALKTIDSWQIKPCCHNGA